jgi:hypothetical protein
MKDPQDSSRGYVEFHILYGFFCSDAFWVTAWTGIMRLIYHACAGFAAIRLFDLNDTFARRMSAFGDTVGCHIDLSNELIYPMDAQ